jgi:hypothetical protein
MNPANYDMCYQTLSAQVPTKTNYFIYRYRNRYYLIFLNTWMRMIELAIGNIKCNRSVWWCVGSNTRHIVRISLLLQHIMKTTSLKNAGTLWYNWPKIVQLPIHMDKYTRPNLQLFLWIYTYIVQATVALNIYKANFSLEIILWQTITLYYVFSHLDIGCHTLCLSQFSHSTE